MEELQVIVQQNPGTAKWNFEQLKVALASGVKQYEMMVYTEDTLKTAKADLAMLRKLRQSVEARRKEIKAKCLEPYAEIEAQAKELTGIIDKPIEMIDGQLSGYERTRKEAERKKITEYMRYAFNDLPEEVAGNLITAVYDPRWENATATQREYTEATMRARETALNDIKAITEMGSEFTEEAMNAYAATLQLSAAVARINELNRQKELILEREEAKKRAAEEAATERAQTPTEPPKEQERTNTAPQPEKPEEAATEATTAKEPELHQIDYLVTGTKDQLNDIYRFIRSTGAAFTWREINV